MSGATFRLSGLKSVFPKLPSGRLFNASGRAGPRRLALVVVGVLAVTGLVVVVATSGRHPPPVSRDARMKPVDPLPGGLHSTQEQDALALTANSVRAQAALRAGVSFTPPLSPSQPVLPAPPVAEQVARRPAPRPHPAPALHFVGRPAPAVPRQAARVTFPPPPAVVAVSDTTPQLPPTPVTAIVDPKVEAAYTKQIGDLFSQWGGRPPRTDVVLPPTAQQAGGGTDGNAVRPAAMQGGLSRRGAGSGRGSSRVADAGEILIPAGRGVYAHPILAVNSDASSPVVLQADSGPIAGDRMIGTFARQNNRLVIHVNTVVHDGENIGVDGVVIAPDTMEAAVASNVDQHYLTRFILPAAAAFVEGLGQALATTTNTQTVLSPFGGAAYATHLNFNQQLGVAAGTSAAQIGQTLNQAAPKGPTVSLDANVSVGVMFLSNVTAHHAL